MGRRSEAATDRERERIVSGLLAIARRSSGTAKLRRFQCLQRDRAAAVRPELLELAAALRAAREPEPSLLEVLRVLLTDGVRSPLFNPAVPAERLRAVLAHAQATLAAHEAGSSRDIPIVAPQFPSQPQEE